ncbi:pseudouridine synthase [Kangiella sp. HD9-110m-PIT-SAG07]|nr:pseudouridine synthase [Kangiella sp. HD9-110m-PIT-SAG07]
MSQANHPSFITLPAPAEHTTVLAFLIKQFPHISQDVWVERMSAGKVFWRDDQGLDSDINRNTPYQPNKTLGYYREVPEEPKVPFKEIIIEHSDHFLIAHKPPFLPVMPGGVFVNECLQERLIKGTGIPDLQAVHRLDRDTSGLVLFSTNPKTRHQYHQLFSERTIKKQYQAIAAVRGDEKIQGQSWHIKNHLKRSTPKFLFENCAETKAGQYAESVIECIEQSSSKALFTLSPITGRTHQLRLHMQHIGFPILNDRFYPTLQPKEPDNYQKPLQLHAKNLSFIDPVSKRELEFISPGSLEI